MSGEPEKVDMRRFLWPVENVGNVLAGAASAAVTALEYHCNRINEPATNLSTMFVHFQARKLTGEVATNRGTTLVDVLKAVAAHGACAETTWPFRPEALGTEPPAGAYGEAKKFAGINYYWIDDIFECLAMSYPVPFVAGIPRRCLAEAGNGGAMPRLTEEEIRNAKTHPIHAMTLVGYDRTAKTFLARNCWGEQWGDKGHCTISFDAMQTFCPPGSQRLWVITKPQTQKAEASVAGRSSSAPDTAETGSTDLAKKMRDEIRGSLDKEMADARKRIADMLKKPGNR